jgi:signal recognition particle subunit SRP54
MFDALTEKLTAALRHLRGLGKLSEENMAAALAEVRAALLAADVNFTVARDFVARVGAECEGRKVIESVTPGQQVVKIIHDELTRLLGEGETALSGARPLRVLMAGLHGSGKTTSAAKLGRLLARQGRRPMVVACDIHRPAAIDQLEILARQEGLAFHAERENRDAAAIARNGVEAAKAAGADVVIIDTAGRLQIDEALIEEVRRISAAARPDETLLVADAALGQEAVNVAKAFHEALGVTGLVLTKLDGDARGGAALSIKAVTGVPIKFAGTGEKAGDFEVFHPERLASRILGMGDVVSLVEKAKAVVDEKEAARMAEKIRKEGFDLEDFLAQLGQLKKMGPMQGILGMLPGLGGVKIDDRAEGMMGRAEAIIQSMTLRERRRPEILNGSRRLRIAKGSGTTIAEVNQLMKQFQQMQKMMRLMKGGGARKLMRQMGGMGGGLPGMGGLGGLGGAGRF